MERSPSDSYSLTLRVKLSTRAGTLINEAMKLAAANAIASLIGENELHPEYIVPSVFDKRIAEAVANAVEEAAYQTGVARRDRAGQEET